MWLTKDAGWQSVIYTAVAYEHHNSNYIVTTDLKAGAYAYLILMKNENNRAIDVLNYLRTYSYI